MRNYISNKANRYADVPENLGSERCQAKIDEILNDPAGYKVTDEYNHNDVRQTLRRHFGIKCVYCESSPIASSSFRIDHYRPKKKIKDLPGHTGYYWLAYEWTNLMQSCQFCNAEKSNYFPLENEANRVSRRSRSVLRNRRPDTAPLNREERLLLHPELDKVENHFTFKPDGSIESSTLEGLKSIKCYDLQRGDLVKCRKSISDELLRRVKEAFEEFENDVSNDSVQAKSYLFRALKKEFRELLLKYERNLEYSLYCECVFDNFKTFIIDFITIQEYKELLEEAYTKYKDNQL